MHSNLFYLTSKDVWVLTKTRLHFNIAGDLVLLRWNKAACQRHISEVTAPNKLNKDMGSNPQKWCLKKHSSFTKYLRHTLTRCRVLREEARSLTSAWSMDSAAEQYKRAIL